MTLTTAAWTLFAGAVFGLALAAPPGPMNAVIAEESVLRGRIAGFTAGLGAMTADFVFFLLSLGGAVAFLDDAPTVRAVMILVGGLLMLYFAYGAVHDLRETFVSESDGDELDETVSGGTGRGNPGADGADTDDGLATAFGGSTGGTAADGQASEFGTAPDGQASEFGTAPGTRGFRKAFLLALTNPYQILFWLTVGVGLLRPGTVDVLAVLPVVGTDLAGVLVVTTGSPALLVGLFCGIVVWIVGFPAALVRVGRRVDAFAPAVAGLSAVVLAGFGVTFLWTAATTLL
jgi:threonine/homoserine/homoserine lactone efflux protein